MNLRPILVVDDDEEILELFQNVLEDEGFEVKTASSGKEALEKASHSQFSLALLDIILPDIRGTQIALELKAIDENVAIVFITGYSDVAAVIDTAGYGACDLILKPVSNKKLLEIVRYALSIHADYLSFSARVIQQSE